MAVFAVQYTYPDDMTEMLEHRPEHRAFLGTCEGLLLAGAFKDDYLSVDARDEELEEFNGALLVLEADSIDELADLLDDDPYYTGGFLVKRTIRAWDPPLGSLAS